MLMGSETQQLERDTRALKDPSQEDAKELMDAPFKLPLKDSKSPQEHDQQATPLKKGVHFRRRDNHPLLNMSIAKRLALGFLIPILGISLTLGSVGFSSYQLLDHVSSFNHNLLDAYTSLTAAVTTLEQTHVNVLGAINDATKPQTMPETLREDETTIQRLASNYHTTLVAYLRHDLLALHPDLSALFVEAGHGPQVEQQRAQSNTALNSYQTYQDALNLVFKAIASGNVSRAQTLEVSLVEPGYANAMGSLLILIHFTEQLAPSIHDATQVEEDRMLLMMGLSALSVLIGIAIVAWLISHTLVRRLQRFRSVVQSVERGQFAARIAVEGRDEIAGVSRAVNTTLDTIVGLLEESRRQRDELAKGEELKRLHEALQREHEALNEANTRLALLATIDPLTDLPNHRTVMNRIEEELSRCKRSSESCAVLFVDIDHFKQVNDTWGHQAGDAILHEVGQRLRHTVRLEDFVGRYGGEEFAIILTTTDLDGAKSAAERLRSALADIPFSWQNEKTGEVITIPVTGSIGVAVYEQDGLTRKELIEAADRAMYAAKRNGRNRVCFAGETRIFMQDFLANAPEQYQLDAPAILALSAVAEAHDQGTSAHSQRMVAMAEATARELGCMQEEMHLIRLAALLHDIGKIGVPDDILLKQGPLTDSEWAVMRRHPDIGRQILTQAGGKFDLVSHIVVAHHERWDGSGYPYRLSGESIPLGARILSVVDSYDAMTSERPYRKAMPDSLAREELRRCAGSQFDPRVVEAFLRALDKQEQVGHTATDERGLPDEISLLSAEGV